MSAAMNRLIAEAGLLLQTSRKTVALTGAGVSTESGIPDFRGRNGLWSRYDPMEYGTIGAFRRNPRKIWKMLAELLDIANARPNAGHYAMAGLEEEKLLTGIITQNIDGLHQKAGSRRVVEFHGSITSFSCQSCGNSYALEDIVRMPLPPSCRRCASILKPDVVFIDEQIPAETLRDMEELLQGTEVLLVAGTSCQMAPASFIPARVRLHGGSIIEINREPALGGLSEITMATGFSKAMTGILSAIRT